MNVCVALLTAVQAVLALPAAPRCRASPGPNQEPLRLSGLVPRQPWPLQALSQRTSHSLRLRALGARDTVPQLEDAFYVKNKEDTSNSFLKTVSLLSVLLMLPTQSCLSVLPPPRQCALAQDTSQQVPTLRKHASARTHISSGVEMPICRGEDLLPV